MQVGQTVTHASSLWTAILQDVVHRQGTSYVLLGWFMEPTVTFLFPMDGFNESFLTDYGTCSHGEGGGGCTRETVPGCDYCPNHGGFQFI